jgi:diguanylate cyclase (GGDEF)-like protein/PAS domain S-box-containing protein
MSEEEQLDAQQLATLVKRLDRQRRARNAAEAISEQATGEGYDRQHHLKLLQAVAVAANESPSLDDALQAAVDEVCAYFGFPVGHAYLAIGNSSILALSDIWFVGDFARFEPFRVAVEMTLIAPSSSVAGRALALRAPAGSSELDRILPQPLASAAKRAGLVAAFAFPVIGINAPVAVLEFYATEPFALDDGMDDVIRRLGDLLGKVHVRTMAQATMASSPEQFRLLFEGNPNPMWIHDAESFEMIAVNDAATLQFGYTREELLALTLPDLQSSQDRAAGPPPRTGALNLQTRAGTFLTFDVTGYDIRLPGRNGRMTMAVDVDEGRRAAEGLRDSERRFREMLDTIQLAAVLLDVVGHVTYCNPYLLQMTGFVKDEVLGNNFFELFLPEEQRAQGARNFASNIGGGMIALHDESEIVTRRGERRTILWNNTVLRNSQGSILGTAGIGSDVTEQRIAEKQLLFNAFHDSLTGLPNRALFLDRVSHALNRVKRDGGQAFTVLLLDVDHFKNVNDSLGHAMGDQLLIAIGERLTQALRAADTVARFGGDEFTILVEPVTDATGSTRAAERIQRAIAAPFQIGESEIFVSISLGVTLAGPEYEDPGQIVRDADTAMYRAKGQGRGRSEIFDANMRAEVVARLQLENDLRRAVERDELRVMYQPLVRLDSTRLVGFEALVRWQHPRRGLVSPASFIPIAEESGLIVSIGQFVLAEASRQAAVWLADGQLRAGRRSTDASAQDVVPLHVSVNVSTRQFAKSDLVADVRRALEASGLPPSCLHIEVTESVIMLQPEAALKVMNDVRDLGCRISLDDFGTGYSSLSYLHRFPIDILKIDASFVQNATRDKKNVEIIRSIIALARALAIEVIAEGIETAEQHEMLRDLGCPLGQGYLFARPLATEQALEFTRR